MDINTMNKGLDKFMRRIHGVDVYLTDSLNKFGSKKYLINIFFFPSKFLKGSPEYSEKYHNFFNTSRTEIENDIFRSFKYLGINSEEVTRNNIKLRISSDIPEYIRTYGDELVSNINNFIETETVDGISLSDKMSDVKVDRIFATIPYYDEGFDSHILLRLDHEVAGRYLGATFLNDKFVRDRMIDYLKTKMDLDPQIDFWFD